MLFEFWKQLCITEKNRGQGSYLQKFCAQQSKFPEVEDILMKFFTHCHMLSIPVVGLYLWKKHEKLNWNWLYNACFSTKWLHMYKMSHRKYVKIYWKWRKTKKIQHRQIFEINKFNCIWRQYVPPRVRGSKLSRPRREIFYS